MIGRPHMEGGILKIGVTGATGVLGRILLECLGEQQEISCFKGDITDIKDVNDWIGSERPDQIFHLAAIVAIKEVEADPANAYNVNVNGMVNLLSAIHLAGRKPWIFFSSTSHVYKSSSLPIAETSAIEPINVYGQTKYLAERVLVEFAEKNQVGYCIGRIFSFYHHTQKEPFLYPTIIRRLREHGSRPEPFVVHGANNIRDISDAEEIVDLMVKLSKVKAEGIYNLGSGKGTRIADFVRALSGEKLSIKELDSEAPQVLVADTSKVNKLLERYGR